MIVIKSLQPQSTGQKHFWVLKAAESKGVVLREMSAPSPTVSRSTTTSPGALKLRTPPMKSSPCRIRNSRNVVALAGAATRRPAGDSGWTIVSSGPTIWRGCSTGAFCGSPGFREPAFEYWAPCWPVPYVSSPSHTSAW